MIFKQIVKSNNDSIYLTPLMITLNDNAIEYDFKKTNTYYIKITLDNAENNNYYTELKLFKTISNIQLLYKTNKQIIEYIFTPNEDSIRLNITTNNTITNINMSLIKNILPCPCSHIGIQGIAGQLCSVNGEQIVLGRNGLYEINNPNLLIQQVGFIPKAFQPFALDYEYEE